MNFQDIIRNVYDQDQNLLRTTSGSANSTVIVGNATFYAVVNTAAAGQASVVLDNSLSNIGFATVSVSNPTLFAVVNDGYIKIKDDEGQTLEISANPADGESASQDMLVTAAFPYVFGGATHDRVRNVGAAASQASLARGVLAAGIMGYDGSLYQRIATDSNGILKALPTTTLGTGLANIGFATVQVASIAAGANYIGLASVNIGGGNVGISGNVTLSDSKAFIGLVTAQSINNGTNKTLVILPIGLGNNSLATVAVPTNAQRIKVTNLLLSSNVTTEVAVKSGVTYLTGNASLGVTLFPGGGFELPGSPDSPAWISLPSGALVVEKRDPGGTTSKIGGHAIYFDEV